MEVSVRIRPDSDGVYTNHRLGLTTKGTPTFAPRITATNSPAQPTRVTIVDCADGTHWLVYYKKTGKLQDNIPGGRQRVQALVVLAVGTCEGAPFSPRLPSRSSLPER